MAKFELEYIFIEGTVARWGSFESVFKFFFHGVFCIVTTTTNNNKFY